MDRRTKAQLQQALAAADMLTAEYRTTNEELRRDYHSERERFDLHRRDLMAHRDVLLGDRDRLTATIEVLSRRLARPYAESNALNLTTALMTNQKAEPRR